MKTNKGVSLIVLVVTIIVMIIIAGAIIISLTDTNIIEQAENAATSYRVAQFKENLNIEKQQKLLAEYGTTEGVDISVRAILDITEENEEEYVVNIATANSIPANMPAGTYYKLDENRYATRTRENKRDIMLASRAIDRDNELVTNTYVVNDNFDVYYIISGTIGKPEIEINDERVIELLESMDNPMEASEEEIIELKKELHLEHIEGNRFKDIGFTMIDENYEKDYVYFPTRERMYLVEGEEVGKEYITTITYVSKEEIPTTYEYACFLMQMLAEAKTAFVGKTLTEIQTKYNQGILDEYVLEKCSNILSVETRWYMWDEEYKEYVFFDNISFKFNGILHEEFTGYNTYLFQVDEKGKFIDVYFAGGA